MLFSIESSFIYLFATNRLARNAKFSLPVIRIIFQALFMLELWHYECKNHKLQCVHTNSVVFVSLDSFAPPKLFGTASAIVQCSSNCDCPNQLIISRCTPCQLTSLAKRQPCDVTILVNLKHELDDCIGSVVDVCSFDFFDNYTFFFMIRYAYNCAFTRKTITSEFKKSGIWPVYHKKIAECTAPACNRRRLYAPELR